MSDTVDAHSHWVLVCEGNHGIVQTPGFQDWNRTSLFGSGDSYNKWVQVTVLSYSVPWLTRDCFLRIQRDESLARARALCDCRRREADNPFSHLPRIKLIREHRWSPQLPYAREMVLFSHFTWGLVTVYLKNMDVMFLSSWMRFLSVQQSLSRLPMMCVTYRFNDCSVTNLFSSLHPLWKGFLGWHEILFIIILLQHR
jgi:hypothetical protein